MQAPALAECVAAPAVPPSGGVTLASSSAASATDSPFFSESEEMTSGGASSPAATPLVDFADGEPGTGDASPSGEEGGSKMVFALAKLAGFMKVDAKFPKACQLLHKSLVSAKPDELPLFMAALGATQTPPERAMARPARSMLRRLFEVIEPRRDHFPWPDRFQLDTWILRCIYACRLFTDDTYQFAAASKPIREAIVALDTIGRPPQPPLDPLLLDEVRWVNVSLETWRG